MDNASSTEPVTAFLVEPSGLMQKILEDVVGGFALETVSVDSASAAISMLPRHRPALIVTAQTLPDLPGVGLTAAVKASEAYGHAKVVIASSNASDIVAVPTYGPDLVVPKVANIMRQDISDFILLMGLAELDKSGCQSLRGDVLVADDDRLLQMVLGKALRAAGAEVTVVGNGRDAVREASQNAFRLMLMDIEMPEINGWKAIQAVRRRGIETPAIAVTSHSDPNLIRRCREAGFNGMLTKPVDRPTLVARCAQLMG